MPNLLTRVRTPQTQAQPMWEPFRLVEDMFRWDPFKDARTFPMLEASQAFMPSFEVKETPGAYTLRADLPGIKDEDVDINVVGNRLTITGKREAEKKEDNATYHLYERSYGSFTRSFNLPEEVEADHVHAELKQGVLTLSIPKKPEAKPQKVQIHK